MPTKKASDSLAFLFKNYVKNIAIGTEIAFPFLSLKRVESCEF
jgi:hypothetical protein